MTVRVLLYRRDLSRQRGWRGFVALINCHEVDVIFLEVGSGSSGLSLSRWRRRRAVEGTVVTGFCFVCTATSDAPQNRDGGDDGEPCPSASDPKAMRPDKAEDYQEISDRGCLDRRLLGRRPERGELSGCPKFVPQQVLAPPVSIAKRLQPTVVDGEFIAGRAVPRPGSVAADRPAWSAGARGRAHRYPVIGTFPVGAVAAGEFQTFVSGQFGRRESN